MIGHLLECAGQVTGGYFADPGRKEVPGLAELGFPFADVGADGSASVRQTGRHRRPVSRATVREQLLYEITDPAAYLHPGRGAGPARGDRARDTAPDRVAVAGASAGPGRHG